MCPSSRDIKIVNKACSMNLAAVFRNVGITKCVPEGALCKHVTQMAIAPLDSTCGDSRKCTAGASDSRKGSQSESKNETDW